MLRGGKSNAQLGSASSLHLPFLFRLQLEFLACQRATIDRNGRKKKRNESLLRILSTSDYLVGSRPMIPAFRLRNGNYVIHLLLPKREPLNHFSMWPHTRTRHGSRCSASQEFIVACFCISLSSEDGDEWIYRAWNLSLSANYNVNSARDFTEDETNENAEKSQSSILEKWNIMATIMTK